MSMRKIWATRVGTTTAEEYIGSRGTIFFNELTGALRISDGVTVGGQPLTLVSSDFQFQFGDFVATTEPSAPFGATLMSANNNQDINIVSNGTGKVNIAGEFNVHKTDGNIADILAAPPIFSVTADGQVQMLVPGANDLEGAVTIVGGLDGVYQPPVLTGVMLHITGIAGSPGVPSRVYNDSQNAFSAFVARRYNGTALLPTAVLDGEEIMRLSGTAHNGTIIPGSGNQRIIYKALGNQTLTNQGGTMEFWATPQNTTTIAKVATVASTGITLESGKTLTGNVTGTADIATTVTLVATNSTAATHYLTFVDSATGNENVRTDTDLTYNPSTNTLFVPRLQSKLYRYSRDAGTIAAGGTLTLDFSTDDVVYCVWGDGMTIAYQNFTAGSVIRLMARKATGTGVDTVSLDGVTAAQVSTGATTTPNVSADTTLFIEFTCIGTTIGTVYIKL